MKVICGYCGKTIEDLDEFPKDWVVPTFSIESEREEDGTNPLGYGVVKAFCSEDCAKTFQKEYYKKHLFSRGEKR